MEVQKQGGAGSWFLNKPSVETTRLQEPLGNACFPGLRRKEWSAEKLGLHDKEFGFFVFFFADGFC